MQVLSDIPVQMQNAWNAATEIAHNITERICAIALSIIPQEWTEQVIKPWYERNLAQLTADDYLMLVIGLEVSIFVLGFGLHQFGAVALPLGLCAAGMIMGGCGLFVQKRLQQYYNEQAWEQIDLMRRAANDITSKNLDFSVLLKERAILEKPEFAHLQEDLKKLDEETRRFRTDIASPDYENKKDIVKTHLDALAAKVQANAQDKAIVDALLEEIDKTGTDEQDLSAIEMQKQKLKDLQTPQALLHQVELTQQINEMVKAVQGPIFSKTKEAYLEYLKGMQQKYSKKDVEDLP